MLDNTRTNRILIYPGSFNPPHRGHLHLLKHISMRGTHDMNVIAAIILPRSDESVAVKVQEEYWKFMLGIDERCLLWKQDLFFPSWAWVYEERTKTFTAFRERLVQAAQKDGYSIEFVPLYGAGIATPGNPPNPAYGCETLIMSDAARAADFMRFLVLRDSDGCIRVKRFLRDFDGCTTYQVKKDPYRRGRASAICEGEGKPCVAGHEDYSSERGSEKARGRYVQEALSFGSISSALRYPATGPGYVEEATETAVAKAVEELKAVVTCQRQVEGRMITLHFVKCEDVTNYSNISSTIVRNVMIEEHGIKLKAALNWMALGAEVLWRYKDSWIDKARLGTSCCINFQQSTEELQFPEKSTSYENPLPFEKSPSLEELGLVKAVETSPSIEKPPSLERPTSHEKSPSFEEP